MFYVHINDIGFKSSALTADAVYKSLKAYVWNGTQ